MGLGYRPDVGHVLPGLLGSNMGSSQDHARFVTAGPFWRFILKTLKTPALTMPWGRVYWNTDGCSPELIAAIIAHENVHLDQIRRDGAIGFSIRYLYGLARYGYWNMPYEKEARAAHE
jgi:hypothetical protein